jgi:chromosome segregation ATPase
LYLLLILSSLVSGQELTCAHDATWETFKQDLKTFKQDMTSLTQSNAECTNNYKTIDSELKSLKEELADLKTKFQESKDCNKETANLETRLIEHFKKEFNAFVSKLNN